MKKTYYELNNKAILIDNYLYPRVLILNDIEVKVYPMTSTGVKILSYCNGLNSKVEIIEQIANNYKISRHMAEEDVESFLRSMITEEIIKEIYLPQHHEIDIRGNEELMIPYQLTIETTNQCQLKCKHCYNRAGTMRKGELSVKEWIGILKDYKRLGGVSIMLTGGEIFLKKNIDQLIDFVANNFIRVVILTNGYTISDKILEVLKRHRDKIALQISLDGLADNHDFLRGVRGAYEKSMQNIQKLIESKIKVSIACTLNEKNLQDLPELIQNVKSIGCFAINIGAVSALGRALENNVATTSVVENLHTLIMHMKNVYEDETFIVGDSIESFNSNYTSSTQEEYKNKCGAGYKILHIFSDGKIGLCPSHGSIIDQFTLGNLKECKMEELFNYKNLEKVLNIISPNKQECGNCVYFHECAECIIAMLGRSEKECSVKRRLIRDGVVNI